MRRFAVLAALALVSPTVAHAQGTLAAQGLGYPSGGVSTRTLGAGGAAAEVDPVSTLNPAALAQVGTFEVFGQGHVERRRTEVADPASTAVIPTFPLAGFAMSVSSRWVVGISLSSFLDRTWATITERQLILDGTEVTAEDRASSEGSINDIRLGVAYRLSSRVALGLGGHLYTGENRLQLLRRFPDESGFGTFTQGTVLDYVGNALSAGVLVQPTDRLAIGLSGQLGFDLEARQRDSLLASASVPARMGISAQYRIAGAAFSARAGWTQWTDLADLSERDGPSPSTLEPNDTFEYAFGVDLEGPTLFRQSVVLRTGIARRDLPFGVGGNVIAETQVSGGIGIPLARGRALLDLAVVRASRSGVSGASERGWITSLGLLVRP